MSDDCGEIKISGAPVLNMQGGTIIKRLDAMVTVGNVRIEMNFFCTKCERRLAECECGK